MALISFLVMHQLFVVRQGLFVGHNGLLLAIVSYDHLLPIVRVLFHLQGFLRGGGLRLHCRALSAFQDFLRLLGFLRGRKSCLCCHACALDHSVLECLWTHLASDYKVIILQHSNMFKSFFHFLCHVRAVKLWQTSDNKPEL